LDGLILAESPIPGCGRVVYAARDFEPGEELCRVPAEIILSVPFKVAQVAEEEPEILLAQILLAERHLGAKSFVAPYVASLPAEGEYPSVHPLFWPADLCLDELFAGSAHGMRWADWCLRSAARRVDVLLSSGAAVDDSEARWALATVDSRGFTFQPDSEDESLALVPFLDMVNTGVTTWKCSFKPPGPPSEGAPLEIEEPIRRGEEILYEYGANSSAMLWMRYGFLGNHDGPNPHEGAAFSVNVQAALASDAADLREAKVAALVENQPMFEIDDPLFFTLPDDAEFGRALYPVSRLLACCSIEELEMLRPTSLWPPMYLGPEFEVRARSLLAEWLRGALQACDDSACKLQEALAKGTAGFPSEQHRSLHEFAARLLERERPLLEFEFRSCEDFLSAAAVDRRAAFEDEWWDRRLGWKPGNGAK